MWDGEDKNGHCNTDLGVWTSLPHCPPRWPLCSALSTSRLRLSHRSWLWMRRTRGYDWRACLRAQTTRCSCRRRRTPSGAASPPPPSPQVRDFLPPWCLLLPWVASGSSAASAETWPGRSPSEKLNCLFLQRIIIIPSTPAFQGPARNLSLPRQPQEPAVQSPGPPAPTKCTK